MVAAIAAPPGYTLIEISDDDGDPVVENRLSEPEIVLGFVIIEYENKQLGVRLLTTSGIVDGETHALVRPDGKIECDRYCYSRRSRIFDSLDDLKQAMRWEAAESYTEAAAEAAKSGNKKDAASFRRCAKQHRDAFEENEY